MLMTEAKVKGIIPYRYHFLIDDECICGAELDVQENLKAIYCSDPNCRIDLAARVANVMSNFGVKGLGFSYALDILKKNPDINSPLLFFCLEERHFPTNSADHVVKDFMLKLRRVTEQAYTLGEVISKMNYPGFVEKATDVFQGVGDMESFMERVNEIEIEDPFDRLVRYVGNKIGSYNIKAREIAEVIQNYYKEIEAIPLVFERIWKGEAIPVKICVTGDISRIGNMSREKFFRYLNELGRGHFLFKFSRGYESVCWVVCDDPDGCVENNSYIEGKKRGILCTSDEFVALLKEGKPIAKCK